ATGVVLALSQSALAYDTAANRSRVAVRVSAPGVQAPWSWIVAVRGSVVASGSTSHASVDVAVSNDCSITPMSPTARITDALGQTAAAATRLDASRCPPPPDHAYAWDRILASPTLDEASFVDRLRATGSPTLGAGPAIYRQLVRGGINPAFALGMF